MTYDEEILTIKETMALLCIGRNTLYGLLGAGEISAF